MSDRYEKGIRIDDICKVYECDTNNIKYINFRYKIKDMYMKHIHTNGYNYDIDTRKKDWIFYYPVFFSILLQRTDACYGAFTHISIPTEMLPEKMQKVFLSDEGTLMFIMYDTTMSADETMEAVEQIRAISNEQCFLSGMSAVVTDIRNLSNKEVPIYVILAVILSLIVLSLTMDSFLIPIFFLLSIGMAIIYNLGTNIFMGEISYVTKALSAVLPDVGKISGFVTKRFPIFLLIFAVLLVPAVYGQKNAEVYYDLAGTLPEDLQSFMANQKLDEEFDMNSTHILLADSHMKAKDAEKMLERIDEVDGVKAAIGIDSIIGPSVPKDMIPQSIRDILEDDKYQMILISSEYKTASDEVNAQIDEINDIVDDYDENGMLIGEAPCTKDLITITDTDFKVVSAISIVAIFVIIALVFRSITLPVILVAVIEFAIFVNMCIPFYTHTQIPFIASIVIGTIQLGATVDYAILMTNNYKGARMAGLEKKEAVQRAVASSAQSIVVSALSFFASTFGVGVYSNIDMISSLCILMARGALISMVVVIFVLPAMYMVFDKVICATSAGFRSGTKGKESKTNEILKSKTVS